MDWISPTSLAILRELRTGPKDLSTLVEVLGPKLGCKRPFGTVQRWCWKLTLRGLLRCERVKRKTVYSLKKTPLVSAALQLAEAVAFEEATKASVEPVAMAAREVVRRLSELNTVLEVIFYGSFAREGASKSSDLDVVVVGPPDMKEKISSILREIPLVHPLVLSWEQFGEISTLPPEVLGHAHAQEILRGIRLRLPL